MEGGTDGESPLDAGTATDHLDGWELVGLIPPSHLGAQCGGGRRPDSVRILRVWLIEQGHDHLARDPRMQGNMHEAALVHGSAIGRGEVNQGGLAIDLHRVLAALLELGWHWCGGIQYRCCSQGGHKGCSPSRDGHPSIRVKAASG